MIPGISECILPMWMYVRGLKHQSEGGVSDFIEECLKL
jgi:hypothetical protein